MLAGLLLSILAAALVLLPSAGEAPSAADPPARVVRLALAGTLPSLLASFAGTALLTVAAAAPQAASRAERASNAAG